MSRGTSRGRLGHLVVLRAQDDVARAACARLALRLRPMLARMHATGAIEHWWLGRSGDASSTAAALGLPLVKDCAGVVFLAVRDDAALARYYDDPEHRDVRDAFYRELDGAADACISRFDLELDDGEAIA